MPPVVGSAQGWFDSNGSAYSQVAFNRADYWADKWRAVDDTKLIGVGVGEDINGSVPVDAEPPRRLPDLDGRSRRTSTTSRTIKYESNWTYEQIVYLYEQNVTAWEQSTFTYQQSDATSTRSARPGTSGPYCRTATRGTGSTPPKRTRLEAQSATEQHEARYESDGWRRGQSGGWLDLPDARAVQRQQHDGRLQRRRPRSTQSWQTIGQAAYDASNTTNDSTDGFRRTTTGTGWTSSLCPSTRQQHDVRLDRRIPRQHSVDPDHPGCLQRRQHDVRLDRRVPRVEHVEHHD